METANRNERQFDNYKQELMYNLRSKIAQTNAKSRINIMENNSGEEDLCKEMDRQFITMRKFKYFRDAINAIKYNFELTISENIECLDKCNELYGQF